MPKCARLTHRALVDVKSQLHSSAALDECDIFSGLVDKLGALHEM
jgi:hypothetical protein